MFKVGDRVRYKGDEAIGTVIEKTSSNGIYIVHWDSWEWQAGFPYHERVLTLIEKGNKEMTKDKYEDGWTLNDGKVHIPKDAKTLEDDTGDIVAFKRTVEPVVRYLNVYKSSSRGLYVTYSHPTRSKADEYTQKARVGCIRVELEEGRYDD